MDIIFGVSVENDSRGEVASFNSKILQGEKASFLVILPDFQEKICAMAKEKPPRPTKVGDHVSALATNMHSASECNRHYGGLVKTQRVYGIVRHIEIVLKPGNKVKTTQVTAGFDFGDNSLGIRDFKMVTLNVKRCLLESALEPAAVLVVAHASSQPAPTPPSAAAAAAAATNNVHIIATTNVPTPIQAKLPPNTSIQVKLPPTNTPIQDELPPTMPIQAELPRNIPIQAELPPNIPI
jgi:hypothetical protein